ncbi:MAG TPA: hypothetical protein DCS93_06465 [Microscillaceae bacterium]|nr:hypothetical protein [Microscillaceae bacterium]
MKWNTLYHVYEGLILLLIGCCWWAFFDPFIPNPTHWQSLNQTLDTIYVDAYTASQDALIDLRKEVRKQGNPREGLDRVKRAALLAKKTNQVFASLEEAKGYLQKLDPVEQATTERFMIRSRFAYQLKANLDGYTQWLTNEFRDLDLPRFAPLAEGNEENSLYYVSEPDKDFAHNYFESTPAIGAIALLSQKQIQLKRYEMVVLKKLGSEPTGILCGGGWIAPTLGKLKIVIPVGDEYTADMFIGASARETNPRMILNGEPLSVRSGSTNIRFETKEIGPQFWEGKVVYKHKGRYKTVAHKVPFEVLPKK